MYLAAHPSVIIEAVPNFSEGRRPGVIAAIATALCSAGALLLHQTSDWDHNRSVFTLAGAPDAVLEGLFAAVRVAAEQIDLFEHRGVHPRLGAADVVPLVPVAGITLAECAELARMLGRRIGEEVGLPVYLYEAAATRPERRNLADVRRGEFERLVAEIEHSARQPDFGPQRVGPAGAVIVGARQFLIAYNIFLQTDQVAVAKRIARQIRASNGGLPAVKALGLLVNEQAQVSINLVDFNLTPLPVVMETVTRLAAEQGVAVDRSELIGLLPQMALLQVAAHYLKLADLQPDRVLEQALADALARQLSAPARVGASS
ncbi:MAG TPA: glutamate formimidoyltransferase [Caldilineaceae bacterium]|nr:glutamate formimidoyltransferase [Caldilineaceae bacterium]